MIDLTPSVHNGDHIYGSLQAPIELVEYGDYECPYCGRAYPIIKHIQQALGKDLKFVFRNFPLSKIHPHAFAAAVATEAADLQGKYWEMHDLVFEHQRSLEPSDIMRLATVAGLNIDQFERDLLQQALTDKVERDFESGIRSGVNRTPTFFVNGKKYNGEWEESHLLRFLECELAWVSTSSTE